MTTNKLLCEVGEALYGPRFQADLARDLKVSDRTMRRWVAGQTLPPKDVLLELQHILIERSISITRLITKTSDAVS